MLSSFFPYPFKVKLQSIFLNAFINKSKNVMKDNDEGPPGMTPPDVMAPTTRLRHLSRAQLAHKMQYTPIQTFSKTDSNFNYIIRNWID